MKTREIPTPALVFDEEAVRRNIRKMADYLEVAGVLLRPHTKTHKCPYIAKMQIAGGARGVTVAKLGEADAMVEAGIKDILIANQVVSDRKLEHLARLQAKARVTVAVEEKGAALKTSRAAESHGVRIPVLIEVNIGMDRAGVAPGEAKDFAVECAGYGGLHVMGVMGYEGHCVFIEDAAERKARADEAVRKLVWAADELRGAGIEVGTVSAGGTGTYDVTAGIEGVTEIQAGSYVLMDARYAKLHPEFEQAVYVLATVTASKGGYALVDAGVKSMTRDAGLPQPVFPGGLVIRRMYEEHARIEAAGDGGVPATGEMVKIMPSHVCTTTNLYDRAYVVCGEDVTGVARIAGRGRSD
ncbi:MAG: alanine racemase [Planctomycetes bacterium]|nr:alanine racemase [Planctomycetota bacterium]